MFSEAVILLEGGLPASPRVPGTNSVWSNRVPLLLLEICLAVFFVGLSGLC